MRTGSRIAWGHSRRAVAVGMALVDAVAASGVAGRGYHASASRRAADDDGAVGQFRADRAARPPRKRRPCPCKIIGTAG